MINKIRIVGRVPENSGDYIEGIDTLIYLNDDKEPAANIRAISVIAEGGQRPVIVKLELLVKEIELDLPQVLTLKNKIEMGAGDTALGYRIPLSQVSERSDEYPDSSSSSQ